jgi:hypothetical protein
MAYSEIMPDPGMTVAETSAFIAQAKDVFTDEEREDSVNMIAADPKCGEVMQGTGGVRKVRVALSGRGKRGGARVIYFYHDDGMPLYLLAVFAKNEKDNLSKAERNALKTVTGQIVAAWKKRRKT